MNALSKIAEQLRLPAPRKPKDGARADQDYRPTPCGEIDFDELFDNVSKRYPKIIARLAE